MPTTLLLVSTLMCSVRHALPPSSPSTATRSTARPCPSTRSCTGQARSCPGPQHDSHYSLRTQTAQNKNPTKTVGLAKWTRNKITTKVNVKEAHQQANKDAKATKNACGAQEHAVKVSQLAALEDQHSQLDSELDFFCEYLLICVVHPSAAAVWPCQLLR